MPRLRNIIKMGRNSRARGRYAVFYNNFLSIRIFSSGGKRKTFNAHKGDTTERAQKVPEANKMYKLRPQGHRSSNNGGEKRLWLDTAFMSHHLCEGQLSRDTAYPDSGKPSLSALL